MHRTRPCIALALSHVGYRRHLNTHLKSLGCEVMEIADPGCGDLARVELIIADTPQALERERLERLHALWNRSRARILYLFPSGERSVHLLVYASSCLVESMRAGSIGASKSTLVPKKGR